MSWGNRIVSVVCTICFAISFVAFGFVAVAVPDTATTALADKYAGTTNDRTPFSHDELVDMALAGKRYTFDANDKGALYQAMCSINESAAADGRASEHGLDLVRWDECAAADQVPLAVYTQQAESTPFYGIASTFTTANGAASSDEARMRTLLPTEEHAAEIIAAADESSVLDAEAVSHLDDVFSVVMRAEPVVLGVFCVSVLCAVGVCCSIGRRAFGSVLVAAGAMTLVVFAILGVVAVVDFDGLFAAFHSLFFSQGSWMFDADSLLITMYPEPFWVGMGAIWLCATVLVSVAAIAVGTALRRA